MKVVVFVGSARKKHTYAAAQSFLEHVAKHGDIAGEIVVLSDYRLEPCRGCKLCIDKGEQYCPLDDDRDRLLEKLRAADGVVFATPNYTFQVSGHMKLFLDRIAFYAHRPSFFGKTCTGLVVQGVFGGAAIVKYLGFVGQTIGFTGVKGACIATLEPITEKGRQKNEARIARRFQKALERRALPRPSLLQLMVFRMGRTSMRLMLDDRSRDYVYFRDKGWFESAYYYPVKLGVVGRGAGALFDALSARITAAR